MYLKSVIKISQKLTRILSLAAAIVVEDMFLPGCEWPTMPGYRRVVTIVFRQLCLPQSISSQLLQRNKLNSTTTTHRRRRVHVKEPLEHETLSPVVVGAEFSGLLPHLPCHMTTQRLPKADSGPPSPHRTMVFGPALP
jgi:hypothetical protein